MKGSTALRT